MVELQTLRVVPHGLNIIIILPVPRLGARGSMVDTIANGHSNPDSSYTQKKLYIPVFVLYALVHR